MAKTNVNPFLEMDFTKMPGVDVESILAAQRKNVEALTAANQLAVEGLQAVIRRQAEILRQAMEEAGAMANEFAAAGSPEEKVAKQAELTKVAFEKALANAKELAEMVAKSNTEAAEVLSKRVSEILDEIKVAAARK